MGSRFPKRLARPALQSDNSSFRISESGAADVGRSAADHLSQIHKVAIRASLVLHVAAEIVALQVLLASTRGRPQCCTPAKNSILL